MTDPPEGEINHYAVRPLRTFELEGIRIGGLICNDMWGNPACTPIPEPHLSQQLARMGARIVFHAINGGRDGGAWSENVHWPFHETNMRLRAQAGGIWVVSADNCAPENIPCSAPSGVLKPNGHWAPGHPDRASTSLFIQSNSNDGGLAGITEHEPRIGVSARTLTVRMAGASAGPRTGHSPGPW